MMKMNKMKMIKRKRKKINKRNKQGKTLIQNKTKTRKILLRRCNLIKSMSMQSMNIWNKNLTKQIN